MALRGSVTVAPEILVLFVWVRILASELFGVYYWYNKRSYAMKKHINRECKTHGLSRFILEGRGYYRCTKCRSERVSKRRKKVKQLLVEYKGGSCERCGYNKCISALEFHHTDPSKKDFGISGNGNTLSIEKMKKEADKCILVCSNCHKEIHDAL